MSCLGACFVQDLRRSRARPAGRSHDDERGPRRIGSARAFLPKICTSRRHRRSKQMSAQRVRRRFISDKAFRISTFGLLDSVPALSESKVISTGNDSVPVTKVSGASTEGTPFGAHADATLQSESLQQSHCQPDLGQVKAYREMHVKGDPQPQKYLNAQLGTVPYWLSVSNGARDW